MTLLNWCLFLIVTSFTIPNVNTFIPADLIDKVFSKVDKTFLKTLDIYGETTTHDDIIKYGIIESIVEYFYNQTNGSSLVNRTKATNEYYDLRYLYYDYYGVWKCDLDVSSLIKYVFKPNVAIVDLNPTTKDLPYAHFDAETFIPSNERVMNFTRGIYTLLSKKDYDTAQEQTGQILHTIQDFYSHSNWVEMGKTDINYDIGNENFTKQAMIGVNETDACASNCTFVSIECGTFLKLLIKLIDFAGFKFDVVSCKLLINVCILDLKISI
jgi:hypothetical protein